LAVLPLAEAIIFAMIASFILSRTLVPTMAANMLRAQVEAKKAGRKPQLYPQIGVQGTLSNNKQSVNRLFRGSTTTPNIQASNEILASASWEPDF